MSFLTRTNFTLDLFTDKEQKKVQTICKANNTTIVNTTTLTSSMKRDKWKQSMTCEKLHMQTEICSLSFLQIYIDIFYNMLLYLFKRSTHPSRNAMKNIFLTFLINSSKMMLSFLFCRCLLTLYK